MDMINIFHGSLTIEDKTSTGTGNVRFSNSDTDISLSSSSIISSSSSVSLFSFDGAETAVMPTSGIIMPTSTTAITTLCGNHDFPSLNNQTLTLIEKQDKNNHSIFLNSTMASANSLTGYPFSENDADIKVQNKLLDFSNVIDLSDRPLLQNILQDGDACQEEGEASNCGVESSSESDYLTFQMNLKNLTRCESFCQELEKKKNEKSGYVVCDLDDGSATIVNICNFTKLDDLDQEGSESRGAVSLVEIPNEEKMDLEITEEMMNSLHKSDRTNSEETPNKKGLHVRFPSDDKLITGYVFPEVPWKNPLECSTEELVSTYLESCVKYDTSPSEVILSQLKAITDFSVRNQLFSLKGVTIDWKVCETLETIFKRVQFDSITLESTGLTEQTAMVMFDLLNYYEPCCRLNLSHNNQMGIRGWQACGSYLRQSQMVRCFEARHSNIPEYSLSPVFRGIQMCTNLTSLHLQSSVNPGRSLQLLASGLRGNKSIQDIYLGDNRFNPSDGLQLADLLKDNANLQLIDLRNNNLQDIGANYIFEALAQSSNCNLNTLIVWNNNLTKGSMSMLSKMLKTTKSLETINLGHNSITDEGVYRLKEGLIKNNSLLRIGLQAIKVTCEGVVALAEFIIEHGRLQKLDLRGNRLETAGLMALSQSLRVNKSVTCVAMDMQEEAEMVESIGNHTETKKKYMEDIVSYTLRNSDVDVQNCNLQAEVSSEILIEASFSSTDDHPPNSQSHDSKPRSDPASDSKRHFQKRCQTLESPSIFGADVPLFPFVIKSGGSEKSTSNDSNDVTPSSSSSSLKCDGFISSGASSVKLQSVISPAALMQSSSSSLPSTSSCPPLKPLVSKRKFTVSKAILPSIFNKSSSNQQPSVLFTASPDVGSDSRVDDGHGDAKVRIIGIQSEEKENTTPMETSTNDVDNSSVTPPP